MNEIWKSRAKLRTSIFLVLSLIAYIFTFFYLFAGHDLFASIVCIFFLFIFFHFLCLDIKKFKTKYFLMIMFILTFMGLFVLLSFGLETNIWLILAVITFNTSLFVLYNSLKIIQFSSISYFLRWWYIFTLFITVTYSLALVWMFSKFPLTCDWLQWASNKLIEFVEKPFKFSVDKIGVFTEWVQWNLIWKFETEAPVEEKKIFDMDQVLLKAKDKNISIEDTDENMKPIITQFNKWKSNAIDQIMWQQESYSVWVCDMVLNEINKKFSLKWFGLSVVLLSYFLLFGFVRIAFFIMSFIWFLLFKLLYLTSLYRVRKVKKEVDDIV